MSEKERQCNPIRKVILKIKGRFEKTQALPIDIKDLIAHPEDFVNLKKIGAVGYPVKVSRETTSIPIPRLQNMGNNVFTPVIDWIINVTDTYMLHISESHESPAFPMIINSSTYRVIAPIEPKEINLDSSYKYNIVGKVIIAKAEKGDVKRYMLEVSKVELLQHKD